jgi:hypothetical protein
MLSHCSVQYGGLYSAGIALYTQAIAWTMLIRPVRLSYLAHHNVIPALPFPCGFPKMHWRKLFDLNPRCEFGDSEDQAR